MHSFLPQSKHTTKHRKAGHSRHSRLLYLSAAIASGSLIPRILSSESHDAGASMGSVDELEVTLRWDCLFFFIFAFWGSGQGDHIPVVRMR